MISSVGLSPAWLDYVLLKIAPIVNTHYDTCRPSSIFASMDARISVTWLMTSRGKTSASGLALLISSAVGNISHSRCSRPKGRVYGFSANRCLHFAVVRTVPIGRSGGVQQGAEAPQKSGSRQSRTQILFRTPAGTPRSEPYFAHPSSDSRPARFTFTVEIHRQAV